MKSRPISREHLLTLARTALAVGEKRYARRITLAWLAIYPGDLPVSLLYDYTLIKDGMYDQALSSLERLCLTDPEYLEAQQALAKTRWLSNANGSCNAAGAAFVLGDKQTKTQLPKWAPILQKTRQLLFSNQIEAAEKLLHIVLPLESQVPLISIMHLRLMKASQSNPPPLAILNLAKHATSMWPECLTTRLALSDALAHIGNEEQAIALLHQVATQDVTGQVATRWWGSAHPYKTLWPTKLEAGTHGPSPLHDIPIPAAVTAAIGLNRLKAPVSAKRLKADGEEKLVSKSNPEKRERQTRKRFRITNSLPKHLRPIQAELGKLARQINKPELAYADCRYPAYVIITTQRGLEAQYGIKETTTIKNALKQLAQAIQARPDSDAILLIADDPQSTKKFHLKAVAHNDAWGIKHLLTDLDTALVKRGERIGALLIVGGPQVIPFHHLPNPVEDADTDVPSDNPYACKDENYFTPEWPLGRLPGDFSSDSGPLLRMIEVMIKHHQSVGNTNQPNRWQQMRNFLLRKLANRHFLLRSFGKKLNIAHKHEYPPNLGYSAAVWQRSSLAVYRAIGEPRSLLISPPTQAEQISLAKPSKLAYFNLHGIPDSAIWYGQCDPTEQVNGSTSGENIANNPYYPIALRPEDVRNSGSAPRIIFSEACYGAHIFEKSVEDALSLKFLVSGSQAVIGSTCTSYGSVTMPLIAADLLGRSFWAYLLDGLPAGEALRRAKIALAREMINRQGYLDGEDQKTLISFVFYGDPLAHAVDNLHNNKFNIPITKHVPMTIHTVQERSSKNYPVPREVLTQIKQIVADYLPGMDGADAKLSREQVAIPAKAKTANAGHQAATHVITLSKSLGQDSKQHWQYAHLTLNKAGKLVKLAVSR